MSGTAQAILGHLSDCHLADRHRGGPPLTRMLAALDRLDRPDCSPLDAVVVTGDLTDGGTAAELHEMLAVLSPRMTPTLLVKGNHDGDGLRAVAEELVGDVWTHVDPQRLQYAVDVGPVRVAVLDSTVRGSPNGNLGPHELGWLHQVLDDSADRPVVLAMHHPPLVSGIPYLDRIGLLGGDSVTRLAEVCRGSSVAGVLAGHLHRLVVGRLGEVSVIVAPSTLRSCRFTRHDNLGAYSLEPLAAVLHLVSAGPRPTMTSHLLYVEEGSDDVWTR